MADAPAIEIHQTVHGYRDGHELLGASMVLTGATRRTLLALSDLSGDGSPHGFEEYLSGYPLEESGFYAFARTWYADEMSRPGCVWTHTLLVTLQDLGRLPELGTLRAYFRRPDATRIAQELPTIHHSPKSVAMPAKLDGASFEIVTRLYGQDLPVLIFGETAAEYEETFIEVWTQQWDRLRCSFAFCTGALEPRSVEKRPFDLQVIPHQRARRTLRAADRFSVISGEDLVRSTSLAAGTREAIAQRGPREEAAMGASVWTEERPRNLVQESGATAIWRDILVQDLLHPNRSLHRFVEQYCPDVPAKRAAYRGLVECWALVETVDAVSTSLRDVTRALASAFPQKGEGASLKRAVLGRNSILRGARESDLIHELFTLPDASAFDSSDIDLDARAKALFCDGNRWRTRDVSWLLNAEDLNEIGREWASSILRSLSVDDLAAVFSEDRALFVRLLKQRPAFAAQEHLWRQPRELQRAAVGALASFEAAGVLQDVITAIVASNAASLVEPLVQEFGSSIIENVLTGLDRCRRDLRDLDEWQWSVQLRGHEAQLVDWLRVVEQPQPWTLAFVVSLVGLHSNVLDNTADATFLRHLIASGRTTTETWSIEYAAFCLTLGLRNYNGDGARLAAAAFAPVHRAAIDSQVSRRAWQWLGPHLPRPGWLSLEDWDEGEKLRRALIGAFLRYRWDARFLREAVTDEQTARWITQAGHSFTEGHALLRKAGLS